MYSLEFMKFLVARDADSYINEEKESNQYNNGLMFRYAKFATVPVEVKEK